MIKIVIFHHLILYQHLSHHVFYEDLINLSSEEDLTGTDNRAEPRQEVDQHCVHLLSLWMKSLSHIHVGRRHLRVALLQFQVAKRAL